MVFSYFHNEQGIDTMDNRVGNTDNGESTISFPTSHYLL